MSPAADAADRDPGSFVWFISDTQYEPQNTQLALTRGGAWPLVVGDRDVFTLFPVLSDQGGGNGFWHLLDDSPFGPDTLRSSVSADGRIAVVSENTSDPGAIFGPTGASTSLPSDVVAVAFNAGGTLLTADDFGNVFGFPYDEQGNIQDLAVSPFGEGALVTGDEFFFAPTQSSQSFFQLELGVSFQGTPNLEFDALGRPHVVWTNGAAFTFDPISASWTATQISPNLEGSFGAPLPVAADTQGTIGTAFVEDDGDLMYAYWTASAGWNSTLVDVNVDTFYQLGLDFDFDDLPVISYVKNGSVHVAYDPIVEVPEPATLGVALAGLVLLKRRRD
ncbi:MAG: hypothetical protein AAGE65_11220 [Planctomycetota bacterium]